jgi:O-antigen ligase
LIAADAHFFEPAHLYGRTGGPWQPSGLTGLEAKVNKQLAFTQFPAIARTVGHIDVLHVARCVAFVATVLFIWVTLQPFPDLGAPDVGDLDKGKLASTYITLGLFSVAALALTVFQHAKALRSLLTPTFMVLCCWVCINTVFSHDFGLSLQRVILTGSVLVMAACLLLLPDTQEELDLWLGGSVLFFLVVCYLGVLLAPSLSIHMPRDSIEPQLAGDWRGPFGHKNVAAPIMAMLVFVGIYLVARRSLILGGAISLMAGLFVMMAGGKSAAALCVLALLMSVLVVAIKSTVFRVCLIFLPLICLNLATVGSVFDERVAAIVKLLPLDTTFTGRTDIWEFALTSLALHPWLGYGFAAFWGNDAIQNLVQDNLIGWTATAAHSHNGYLDNALTLGIPGLLLIIAIFIVAPLRNFSIATKSGKADPLAKLFLRIWIFGIYLSSLESFLLDRADPIWFTFLISVIGLHYIARFRPTPEPTSPGAHGQLA